jgi:isopentenyl phosphate kinase
MLINMLRSRVAELLLESGHKPVLLPSHQFVGNTSAAEQLERFYDAYRRSLAHLYQ